MPDDKPASLRDAALHFHEYSQPSADGDGVTIDFERMAIDLVAVAKAGNYPRDRFLAKMGQIFDDVHVERTPPEATRN